MDRVVEVATGLVAGLVAGVVAGVVAEAFAETVAEVTSVRVDSSTMSSESAKTTSTSLT